MALMTFNNKQFMSLLLSILCGILLVTCVHGDAEVTPNQNALKQFYGLTNNFLQTIQPHLEKFIFIDFDINNMTVTGDLIKHVLLDRYLGYLILTAIALVFIILVPLIGLCFCCCRCCKRCGGYVKPMEPPRATCRRVVYGIILGGLTTIMLTGVVLAFLSNDVLHTRIAKNGGVMAVLGESLNRTSYFFNSLPVNLAENSQKISPKVQGRVESAVNETLSIFQDKFVDITKVNMTLDAVNSLLTNSSIIFTALKSINSSKERYESSHTLLVKLLEQLNSSFSTPFNITDQEFVDSISSFLQIKVNQNWTLIEFSTVNVQLQLYPIGKFDAVKKNVEESETAFRNMKNSLYAQIIPQLQSLSSSINDFNTTIMKFLEPIKSIGPRIDELNKNLTSGELNVLGWKKTLQSLIAEFDSYRMYATIGVGCVCLLVILFYYLGLCYGFCGEPPYEDAGLCNRGIGANLLMAGIVFSFIFSALIMLFATVFFMMGGPMYTEVCRYLTNDAANGFAVLDKTAVKYGKNLVGMENANYLPDNLASGMLRDCNRDDSSMFKIFKIDSKFKLNSSISEKLDTYIDALRNKMNSSASIPKFELTSVDKLNQTNQLKYQISMDELNKSVIFNYTNVVNRLNNAIDKLDPNQTNANLVDLKDQLSNLTSVIGQLETISLELLDKFRKLQSTYLAIDAVKKYITESKDALNNPNSIGQSLDVAIEFLKRNLMTVFQNILIDVLKNADSCQPLSQALNKMVDLACLQILNPLNAIWCGLGWFLLFVMPSIIFAVKLNNLYRKVEKYVKDFEEPDYIAYPDLHKSDNIPLQRRDKPVSGSNNDSYADSSTLRRVQTKN